MKRFLIFLILFAGPFNHSFAQSLEPGIWKAKTNFKLNGIPLPSSEDEECVSPAEAKDAKATIAKELKKKGCELTKWSVKGKKLEAALSCENKDFTAKGNLQGQFSKKSYHLEGEADGTVKQMLPSTATVVLAGEWVKACAK